MKKIVLILNSTRRIVDSEVHDWLLGKFGEHATLYGTHPQSPEEHVMNLKSLNPTAVYVPSHVTTEEIRCVKMPIFHTGLEHTPHYTQALVDDAAVVFAQIKHAELGKYVFETVPS